MIPVQPEFECLSKVSGITYEQDIKLPQLFRLYIDVGAKICSPPALDKAFKTIDFLVLLDIDELTEQTRTLFFK